MPTFLLLVKDSLLYFLTGWGLRIITKFTVIAEDLKDNKLGFPLAFHLRLIYIRGHFQYQTSPVYIV